MKIKWYGHASFRVTANDGTAVITDPYTPETSGYAPITETPDITIISSDNDSYHCRADLIPGDFVTLNALKLAQGDGQMTIKGVEIQAIEAMEMENHPEHPPDVCGMYRFTMDGISVGHIGDVGNPFTQEQIDFFKDLDVFLVLAGDVPVIDLDDLKTAIDAIQPKLVIPMHFRTLTYKPRNMFWIQNFLDRFDDSDIDFACHYEVALQKAYLPSSTRVLVLDYVRP